MGPVGLVSRCGHQCVVDLLDYIIVKHPTALVSVLFNSLIPHLCNHSSLHLGEFNIYDNRYRCQKTDLEKESRSRASQSHWGCHVSCA